MLNLSKSAALHSACETPVAVVLDTEVGEWVSFDVPVDEGGICISLACWPHQLTLNKRLTLVSREASGPDVVSVDREALEIIGGGPLTSLRAVNISFLNELLVQPFPNLNELYIVAPGVFPSVRSFAATNPATPLYPNLIIFRFELSSSKFSRNLGDNLLEFLRNCPRLEVAFFGYDVNNPESAIEFTTKKTPAVSMPCLLSVTHESPVSPMPVGLFNRLCLPPTCNVTLTINDELKKSIKEPLNISFPTLRTSSYLSNIKEVEITVRNKCGASNVLVVGATFSNSHRKISLNQLAGPDIYPHLAEVVEKILGFLKNRGSGMDSLVQTLHFEHSLGESIAEDLLERAKELAISPQEHATPLKAVTLVLQDRRKLLETSRKLIEWLKKYVWQALL